MLNQLLQTHYRTLLFKFFIFINLLTVPYYLQVISIRFHHSGYENLILAPFVFLLVTMLFVKKIQADKYLWLINTLFLSFLIISAWHSMVNFIYLVFYLDLGISLILFFDPINLKKQLIKFSRLAIGFVFLIAALQKVSSPQFTSGYYYYHEWFNNIIFATFLENFGFTTPTTICLEHWNQLFRGFASADTTISFKLPNHDVLLLSAKILAKATVFFEGMIALLFLVPSRLKISKYKDYFLLLFLIGTYCIAPMLGFGLILAILGFCQSTELKHGRTLYLCVGFYVLIISGIRIFQVEQVYQQLVLLIH